MLLGCIADDFTGASDLANTLTRAGMPTVQYVGVPRRPARPEVAAGVVSLKTRSCPPAVAVERSLAALAWLRDQGCRQILFKVCSTFDSTPAGNIGPVAEALADALGAGAVAVCPAFPRTGRTVYQGHLFVGDKLLSESGLEHHPLNPMTDPDIRRWLKRQTRLPVGHVGLATVAAGAEAVRQALGGSERRLVIVDAVTDGDLEALGRALDGAPLMVGGSGIAIGLPSNFRGEIGQLARGLPKAVDGPGFVLSGSTSPQSRKQVAHYASTRPAIQITARGVLDGTLTPESAADRLWAERDREPMAYSTVSVEELGAVQAELGRERAAEAIEGFFGALARVLVARGARRLAVGGGETSGAVVAALGVEDFEIGPEIDPGVPALFAESPVGLLGLALKSGNFGSERFYTDALATLRTG